MGQPRHGSVLTSEPVTCTTCGSHVYRQYASIVWCDCGQVMANQMGVYHDRA